MNRAKSLSDWRIIRFLRKIDFIVVLLCLVYSFFVNCLTVIVDYKFLIFRVPLLVVIITCIAILAVSVFVLRYYRQDTDNNLRIIIYLSWFVYIPIIYNLLFMFIIDDIIYDLSGVFFGSLGLFVFRIILIAVCVLALGIFVSARLIIRIRHNKGKYIDAEKLGKVKDYIHAVLLLLIIIFIIAAVVIYVVESVIISQNKKHDESVEAFRNEMFESLPDGADYDDLVGETRLVVMAVEEGSKNEELIKDIDQENGKTFRCITVDKEVIEEGMEDYNSFVQNHSLEADFYSGDPNNSADIETETISVGLEIYGVDSGTGKCTMVCVYDKDWKLIKIYCQDGTLEE